MWCKIFKEYMRYWKMRFRTEPTSRHNMTCDQTTRKTSTERHLLQPRLQQGNQEKVEVSGYEIEQLQLNQTDYELQFNLNVSITNT